MRPRLVVIAVAAVLLIAGCDWAQYRFGPDHRGSSPDTSISVATVGSLELDWTATPGGPVNVSPIVVSGVVYVGTDQEYLRAYDAAGTENCSGTIPRTCTALWRGIAYGAGTSSPSADGDLVYLGSDVGDVYAFSRSGCSDPCDYTWVAPLNGAVYTSPVIAGGVLYAGASTESSKLYAFDATGGPPNCDDDYQVCSPLWTAALDSGITGSPAVANGLVYVSSGPQVLAFDAAGVTNCSIPAKTCAPVWTAVAGANVNTSPMIAGGKLFVGATDNKLYAFDAAGTVNCSQATKTCNPLWTAATGGAVSTSPAFAKGVVYIGSADHKLYAFDAGGTVNCSQATKTCNPLWTAATGDVILSSPSIANGVVYVGSTDHKLYAFDAGGTVNCSQATKTCNPLWSATTGGAVNSSPAIANGFVYVGSADGKLNAFKVSP